MLTGVLGRLDRQRILVIGDLMLDRYTIGVVRRVSPEAPVTILQVQREESRPGGAGNAILNFLSLGQEVVAVGRTGADREGEELRRGLEQAGADLRGIVIQPGYQTPLKNRLVAANQQIIRVDLETIEPLPEYFCTQLADQLPELLIGVTAVAISDYGKGLLTRVLLARVIGLARERGIPVIVDPKGRDFSPYAGATLIKPNLAEAIEASGIHGESLERVANRLFAITSADYLMITRSEEGVSLFGRDGQSHYFPARIREVRDVTGAGDTVLAVVAAAMANGLPTEAAAELANIAGAIAVSQFGCARVSLSDLARDLLRRDGSQKVFADDHLLALKQALSGSAYTLLHLRERDGLSSALLRRLRELKEVDVVVHVEAGAPESDLVSALASLVEVDFILLKSSSVHQLAQVLPPAQVVDLRSSPGSA
jgi:D-glycero-beta-D-manno-heptose-7-phosphate kinase